MFAIVWDNQRTRFEDDRFSLVIRTGESVGYRNRLTILSMTQARLAAEVNAEILTLAEQVSHMAASSGDYPGVPEIVVYRRAGVNVAFMWGIVPNGAKKRGAMLGEYRFVAIQEEEIEDCLTRVFDIERALTP